MVRIVLYSHDSAGLGHIRRNLAIAHALTAGMADSTDGPVTGLLVAGRPEATDFPAPAGWDWLIVPGVARQRGGYTSRSLDASLESVTRLRGDVVGAALLAFRPDLVIVDRHPFGVERELAAPLERLRAELPSCTLVLGLRDVLDAPEATAAEWRAIGGTAAVRRCFDAIWVFGDPAVHDAATTGEIPAGLRDLVRHTGYLSRGRTLGEHAPVAEPFVLTTVGGGGDGEHLAALAAAAGAPAGHEHFVVTGPQMSDAGHAAVCAAAGERTTVVRRVPDVLALAQRAAGVVCMGGYNTVCEVMSTNTPALVVPRVHRRAEQRLRACELAATGAVDTVLPGDVDAAGIRSWFESAVGRNVDRGSLDLDGLEALPALATALLERRRVAQGGELVAV